MEQSQVPRMPQSLCTGTVFLSPKTFSLFVLLVCKLLEGRDHLWWCVHITPSTMGPVILIGVSECSCSTNKQRARPLSYSPPHSLCSKDELMAGPHTDAWEWWRRPKKLFIPCAVCITAFPCTVYFQWSARKEGGGTIATVPPLYQLAAKLMVEPPHHSRTPGSSKKDALPSGQFYTSP